MQNWECACSDDLWEEVRQKLSKMRIPCFSERNEALPPPPRPTCGAKHEAREMDSVSEEENPRLEESVEEIEVELKNMTSSSRCRCFLLLFFAPPTIFLSPASMDFESLLLCLLLLLIVVCL